MKLLAFTSSSVTTFWEPCNDSGNFAAGNGEACLPGVYLELLVRGRSLLSKADS